MVRGACGYVCVSRDCDSRSKAGEQGGVLNECEGIRYLSLPQTRIKKAGTERKNSLIMSMFA
jgi:hypothetical protein